MLGLETAPLRLDLAGLSGPIAFAPGTEPVARLLRRVLRGWPDAAASMAAPPLLSVRRSGRSIEVTRTADSWSVREPGALSAVCTLVVELLADFVRANPALGGLHAAAAEFDGRLMLFPATHHAGKSTLMARLAQDGRRVFADDLIPVDLDARLAFATGCMPRLRLPLPAAATAPFRTFVAGNTAAADGWYAYLDTPDAPVVHGDTAPLGAVVVLERRKNAAAELVPMAVEEALLALLVQNTNDALPAGDAFRRYLALVDSLPAWRLVYSDIEDAVVCLSGASLRQAVPARVVASPAVEAADAAAARAWLTAAPGAVRYARSPAVELKLVGDAGFLVDPRSDGLHALNGLGLGLWNLLDTPLDRDTIAAVFTGAFPDVEPASVRADVDALLVRLVDQGLVTRNA